MTYGPLTAPSGDELEILTPSYAPDLELCRDLVASVRRFAPTGTRHRIIVPEHDRDLFAPLANATVSVETVQDVLPGALRRLPRMNTWIDIHAPWPPVRGWVAQQLVKLAAVAASPARSVLVVDSDVVFVRPFALRDYTAGASQVLYRLPDAVDRRMSRHMLWDDTARQLLGLPATATARRHDYICWPCLWNPAVVRGMLQRVSAQAGGRPWTRVIGRCLHVSEMVLYGVFVDEIVSDTEVVTHIDEMRCLTQPDEVAFDHSAMDQFIAGLRPRDVAVMVSARSGTPLQVRREAILRATSALGQ
ncbi:DUF6492 family protein [Georgenia deserti]|uniref:DUF6492 family protein n=1 Tax=Georgenia deserti TaxID=2093781 RepID=A0ABW4LC62_9MICO